MARRSPLRRGGSFRALGLGACAAAALLLTCGSGRAPELAFRKKKKAKFPVTVASASVAVEGGKEDFSSFPNSTMNSAGLKLRLRSFDDGGLSLRLVDPGDLDHGEALDHDGRFMEAEYERHIPGIGDVKGRAASSGFWEVGLGRYLPEVGRLTGALNSRSDWNIGLAHGLPPFRGFKPSARVGATQGGGFLEGTVAGKLDDNAKFKYSVRNPVGKYGPEDWIHTGDIILDSQGGKHEVAVHGVYSQNIPGAMRGSIVYTGKMKQGTFSASADHEKYKVQAKSGMFEAAASLAREDEGAGRNKEVEVKACPFAAMAKEVDGKPRVRVGLKL